MIRRKFFDLPCAVKALEWFETCTFCSKFNLSVYCFVLKPFKTLNFPIVIGSLSAHAGQ